MSLKTYYTKMAPLLCLAPERFRRRRVPGGKKNPVRCGIENSLYPKPRDEMKDELKDEAVPPPLAACVWGGGEKAQQKV